jgi:2-polyprenyl-3-methyl-5-hydroxy-6-metoxy-1,4-benzoquinol methylase
MTWPAGPISFQPVTAQAELGSTRIRVAPQVIDPTELSSRIAATLEGIDTEALDLRPRRGLPPKPYIEAGRRAEALHLLWGTVASPGIPAARGPRGIVGRFVKRVVRRLTHWYVEPRFAAQREIDAELARFATESVLAIRQTHIELTNAKREIDLLKRELQDSKTERTVLVDNAASQEADVAALHDKVDRLAASFGSEGPLVGVLEQLTQVMSRLGISSARGASFDYVAFEERFRGGSEALAASQRDYITKFPPASEPGMIVDVGCGRGEMLQLLQEAGHDVMGVELDDNMLAVCLAKGLPVTKGDGVSWLESAEPDSLKGVFSAQVIEHLLTVEIERFLLASLNALRVGGVLVVETINPRSLFALANHFFADLSHVRPVHPETLRFMCEQIGFSSVALTELSPHPAVAASAVLGTGATETAVKELVNSVFGFQDYAVVATK